jgi:Na+-transporting methylmalonyl-CoA/oxaloacetate decarboxylase gamma subunit
MSVLDSALWITVIGMGLVFTAILLLWGLMAALVRLLPDPPASKEASADLRQSEAKQIVQPAESQLSQRRRRAAAAAVAYCLAQERLKSASQRTSQPITQPTTAGAVRQWQMVQRASQLSQRLQRPNKKVPR